MDISSCFKIVLHNSSLNGRMEFHRREARTTICRATPISLDIYVVSHFFAFPSKTIPNTLFSLIFAFELHDYFFKINS